MRGERHGVACADGADEDRHKQHGAAEAGRAADCRLDPHGSAATLERILPFGTATRAIVTIDATRILIDAPAPAPQWLAGLAPSSRVDVQIDASAAQTLP